MLGALLGSIVGLEIDNNEGTELGLWYVKVLGATFGSMDKFSLGKCDGI